MQTKSIKWQGVQISAMPLPLGYGQSTHKLCFSWSGYISKLARTLSLISHTFFFNLMKMFSSDIGFYLSTCGLQTHKQQAGQISSPECFPLHGGWPGKLQMQRPGPGQGLGSRPQGAPNNQRHLGSFHLLPCHLHTFFCDFSVQIFCENYWVVCFFPRFFSSFFSPL